MRVEREAEALLARLAVDSIRPVSDDDAEQSRTSLSLDACAEEEAKRWLREVACLGTTDRWFAVCPSAKWQSKRWPVDRYARVVEQLIADERLTPVVVGGPEDAELGRTLVTRWGLGAVAAGSLSVRGSAALMGQATFYLGNDTGAMHLAAAEGTPCVAVFSEQDWPGRWDPYGSGNRILRRAVDCSGCLLADCPKDNECLTQITVDEVLRACRTVLHRTEPNRDEQAQVTGNEIGGSTECAE